MANKDQINRYSDYLAKVADIYQRKEVKTYTNLILSLLTASFFAFFAVRPTLVTIAALIKEIKDQKEISQRLDSKFNDLVKAQKEFVTIRSKLELIYLTLPKDPQLSLFLGQIEVLAHENHLDLTTVQSASVYLKRDPDAPVIEKKTQEKTPYPSFASRISASGTYPDLKNFLLSLNNLRRSLNIEGVSLQKGKEKSSEILNLFFETNTFYLPETDEGS